MDRISIRELEYFVAVAEELSFSRAATRLHLSQPPLSRHIKALEDKLGVPLLKRDTQKVSLTRPGALLLADGRSILRQLDRAAEAVQRTSKGEVERLELGFTPSALDERLSRFLYEFRHSHPQVQLRMRELDSPQLMEALQEETLDGAFVGNVAEQMPRGGAAGALADGDGLGRADQGPSAGRARGSAPARAGAGTVDPFVAQRGPGVPSAGLALVPGRGIPAADRGGADRSGALYGLPVAIKAAFRPSRSP